MLRSLFILLVCFLLKNTAIAAPEKVKAFTPILDYILNSDAALPGSITLPNRVEAEEYVLEEGTRLQSTADIDGVDQVAFIDDGDFTEYKVYVSKSGTFSFKARASSNNDGGTITIFAKGEAIGSVLVPNTGSWNSFETLSTNITLTPGNQTLRLAYSGGNRSLFNINWFSVTESEGSPEIPEDDVDWNIASLVELRDAVRLSDQEIVMRPGNYSINDLPDNNDRYILVSGSNNTIDLTGVHIDVPVQTDLPEAVIHFSGRGNTLSGGTIENSYNSGITNVVDFVAYNIERTFLANGAKPHMVIAGNDTTILNTTLIVRGSFPYGYGSYFGINGNNSFVPQFVAI